MFDLDSLTGLIFVGGGLGVWAYRTHLSHLRKVMEMRAMRGEPLDDHKIEIEKLRQEVTALRLGPRAAGPAATWPRCARKSSVCATRPRSTTSRSTRRCKSCSTGSPH